MKALSQRLDRQGRIQGPHSALRRNKTPKCFRMCALQDPSGVERKEMTGQLLQAEVHASGRFAGDQLGRHLL